MPRGGKREGSGRKRRSWFDPTLRWVVRRVRELQNDPEFVQERTLQFLKRHDRNQVENQIDLHANYRKLRQANQSERHAMMTDDCETPLEETRQILATEGFPRYVSLPPANHFLRNKIFDQVAKEATARFKKKITPRMTKDYVGEWQKFERTLSDDA